jgi:hypothetical protein
MNANDELGMMWEDAAVFNSEYSLEGMRKTTNASSGIASLWAGNRN